MTFPGHAKTRSFLKAILIVLINKESQILNFLTVLEV